MEEIVVALMVSPGKRPVITHLCDDGEYLNLAVSIDDCTPLHCAEARPIKSGVVAICAEQSYALDLEPNRRVNKRILSGTFYIVGSKAGRLRSLRKDEIVKYTTKFWEPELFTKDEVVDSWFDGMFCAL